MNNAETPNQFESKGSLCGAEIEYSDLSEIGQAGPETGSLTVDGVLMSGRFGGPSLCDDRHLYVPMFERGIFGSGFMLARIHLLTHELELLGDLKDFIFLDRIENGRVWFFEDSERTVESSIEI